MADDDQSENEFDHLLDIFQFLLQVQIELNVVDVPPKLKHLHVNDQSPNFLFI